MTREIKYRTWVQDENGDCHMENVTRLSIAGEQLYVITDNDKHDGYEFQNPPLMQFTGLLDKNGVEIYEGDIIQWVDGSKYEVYYMNDCFMACNNLKNDVDVGGIKIIGNIYENPELI